MVCVFVYAKFAFHGVVSKFFSPKFFREPPRIALSISALQIWNLLFFHSADYQRVTLCHACIWVNTWISHTLSFNIIILCYAVGTSLGLYIEACDATCMQVFISLHTQQNALSSPRHRHQYRPPPTPKRDINIKKKVWSWFRLSLRRLWNDPNENKRYNAPHLDSMGEVRRMRTAT